MLANVNSMPILSMSAPYYGKLQQNIFLYKQGPLRYIPAYMKYVSQ